MNRHCRSALLLPLFTAWGFSQYSSSELLRRFQYAFNAHDAAGMTASVSDSVEWFSIAGDSLSLEVRGKENLRRWLDGYFQSCPTCRSEFLSLQETGNFVSAVERSSWNGKTGRRSQTSLAVYEMHNGLIRRVWYYPSSE